MAALLVLLLLLAVPPTAFTTTDVYYVTAHDAAAHEQSCPPHQICHNLSYYISQPDSYFTNDTTIFFLEGEHSFDREDLVHVSNVHNLTLKGQGQWPVAGAEETVMQSTVIINCLRGRGGFNFTTSHNITVEGLTVVNCGGVTNDDAIPVFNFYTVQSLFFHKNSIQHMTGSGLYVLNCDNFIVTNCSFYHSALCDISDSSQYYFFNHHGGAVGIVYDTQYSNTGYTLELSHSNMTKCCNTGFSSEYGGGVYLETSGFSSVTVVLNHLVLSQNSASDNGGNLAVLLNGNGNVTLTISNCLISYGHANNGDGGGMHFDVSTQSSITIQNTNLVENVCVGCFVGGTSELSYVSSNSAHGSLSLINSTIVHTETHSDYGVRITGCKVTLTNTRIRLTKQNKFGVYILGGQYSNAIQMTDCQFERSQSQRGILYIRQGVITNCTFSNNTGDQSVIAIDNNYDNPYTVAIINSSITDNNMTGITITKSVYFNGRNVIQNNRNTEGAGITLISTAYISVQGELFLYNNTANKHGGAILVKQPAFDLKHEASYFASLSFANSSSSSVTFSGNRAGKGGSDMYGAILMGCHDFFENVPHVGQPNETSWYFDTPLTKYFHFSDTDRLSSMSSDPIMVCFCNTTSFLPDCSDRTHHMQTYPGLEINPSIATVGYYGGTSPGDVLVSAQHATLVRYYGQNETTNCFQLHILLQNTSSTTALVDIRVNGGLQGWGVSIGVDILECPIGFTQISGQCHCQHFLDASNVQCNLSATPFMFLRSGNSWFAYNNNTQCITGTTNCPFDYCNRSDVSFDIMAPDRQCVANRVGILCGQCQSHLSIMLGSNRCGTCSNWYLFLLPVFALAGIVLVAVLMFLNLSVSVGTINGLLFYVNMVKLNEAFFFPNGSVPVVSQFISWLNLDLGIEMCLFDRQDGYWNTWLQFAFPAYLFLLMGGIIVGCRYSVWLCRLCGSHAVPALATLFLMSYTKILLTVTNALSMSRLPCNDSILTVWSVDGNIEYGSGKHLVLVVFSSGVLVVGLAYPVLVLCAPLLERYSHKCIPLHRWNPVAKFKPLLDAYGGPYKDKYRFWTGVTLMVRLTVTVAFSFTSGGLAVINAYIIISVVVGIFNFWSFTKGVYKNLYLSTLEAFYLLNIFLLSTVSLATASLGSKDYQIATIVSVCLSFVACLVTMAMHLWWIFDLKKIKRRLGFKDRPDYIAVPQEAGDEDDEEDRPPPGSPPSIVYGSCRGEHQFVLEFPHPYEELESSSPVLLAREPLLFDT